MLIKDTILNNALIEILESYLRNNNIQLDVEPTINKILILHIKPESINIIIHDKQDYNGFINKKK